MVILPLAGCTSFERQSAAGELPITFQTASYLTRAIIDGPVFPTTETFGVYSWTDNTVGEYFMNNEMVLFDSSNNVWKTATTYYWPKNQTVDFICFYPYGQNEISVAKTQIKYTGYNIDNNPAVDVMYADKAVGYSGNVDEVDDSQNAYEGVPVAFNHALSKIAVDIQLAYNHKEEADGTITDWKVTCTGMYLLDLYNTGSCTLNLASSPTSGMIGWDKPTVSGFNVWTNNGDVSNAVQLIGTDTEIPVAAPMVLVPARLALPQILNPNVAASTTCQRIIGDLVIETWRDTGSGRSKFLTETMSFVAPLRIPGNIEAWEMNYSYVYHLLLSPTGSKGTDPNDPSSPVDPNDPDLTDVTITFDPAVGGWDTLNATATINI